MQIQLIAIRLGRPLTDDEVRQMMDFLPPHRRELLCRETERANLSRPDVPDEALCAYTALFLGLHALYGWNSMPEIAYDRYGKPYFPDYPDVHFNLSHTRDAVLVGIHDQPLGVDIEKIRPVSERTMERLAGVTTQKEFFESWVRRESRGKWGGSGVAAMRETDAPTMYGERFCFVDTFKGYVACVCTHSKDSLGEVQCFSLS